MQVITGQHNKYEASFTKIQESYRKSKGVAEKLQLEVQLPSHILALTAYVSGQCRLEMLHRQAAHNVTTFESRCL